MAYFEKAVDFYLRGFNSEYIKRRTGISKQSLLKQLLAKGVRYSKDDIIGYQIAYIQKHFTPEDVEREYVRAMESYDDPYTACHGNRLVCCGCGFGKLRQVMSVVLGQERYMELRNKCWKKKQTATMQRKYGVDNAFEKSVFNQFVSDEAVAAGRVKREATLLERYGVSSPNANPEIQARMLESMRKTNLELYGVENAMQAKEVAQRSAQHRIETMKRKYGVGSSVEVPAIRDKIFENRRCNGTITSSVPEDTLYDLLVEQFGASDVKRNMLVDGRYPFHVDFYIPSRDLFIELNGDKGHNDHWFDPDSVRDRQTVEAWTENMALSEAKSGKKSRYRNYLHVWTNSDVRKREYARANNLNYLVFWDGRCVRRKKQAVARLEDAREWFADGCPDSASWRAENTY